MSIPLHQACVPVFLRMLRNLAGILRKAADHAQAAGIDPAVLLASRLAPDMYPLLKQVQVAVDAAVDAAARLAQAEAPAFADDERDFAALDGRVRRAIAYLESLEPARFEGSEGRTVSWTSRGTRISVDGRAYLLNHAMPKFFFHLTTAYAILRHEGVALRKGDFMGKAEE
jgi:hypothetical protein